MIPLHLVTGFLGSGKTTLLRRIAQGQCDRRLLFLVNEFSAVDVDGRRMIDVADASQVMTVVGGSIFCRCRVTDFADRLRAAAALSPAPEAVIVEASGMADPTVLGRMLRETKLDAVFEAASVVSVVDPGSFLKLVHTLPNIQAQVRASDTVLINKVDLYPPETVEQVAAHAQCINPSARVVRCSHADADVTFAPPHTVASEIGDYAGCADPNYARCMLTLSQPVDVDGIIDQLLTLGPLLYRAKGNIPTAQGMADIDVTPTGVRSVRQSAEPTVGPGAVVLIVAGIADVRARALVDQIQSATNQSAPPIGLPIAAGS